MIHKLSFLNTNKFFRNNFVLLLCSGVLLSIPWVLPEFSFLIFISLVPLLALNRAAKSNSDHANTGNFRGLFGAFFIWNLLSTWWISLVSVSGMILIAILNALIMSFVWHSAIKISGKRSRFSVYFIITLFWIGFEFLHHNWFLKWPWLTLGNSLANSVKYIQWFEFTGVLGGSLWILFINFAFYELVYNFSKVNFKKIFYSFVYLFLIVLIPVSISIYIYRNYKFGNEQYKALILQPNIDPYSEKFSKYSEQEQLAKLFNLIPDDSVVFDFIIAPETSVPEFWEDSLRFDTENLNYFKDFFEKHPDIYFIGGAITKKHNSNEYYDNNNLKIFNSAILYNHNSGFQIYHKNILVNGVETIPLNDYLSFFEKYLIDIGGGQRVITKGNENTFFEVKENTRIAPIICYESTFGEYVARSANSAPDFLVIITNDGWWEKTAGINHHFSYSRLRAIESRKSILRSANTGISANINQLGDVVNRTEVGEESIIECNFEINKKITFYSRNGDYIGRFSLVLSIMIILFSYLRTRKIF